MAQLKEWGAQIVWAVSGVLLAIVVFELLDLRGEEERAHELIGAIRSGDVAVFDAETREEVHRIPMLAEAVAETDQRLFREGFDGSPVPVGIVVHPSGELAYVANTNADVISVLDLKEWKLVGRLVAGREPDGMAWVPPGSE